MKQTKFETVLYSTIGVIVMAVILLAVNIIVGALKMRVDMTEDNLYTLSPGTEAILAKLDTPVTIRLYATRDAKVMPVPLKNYAREVEDFLTELRRESGGNIIIEKLDPVPDSDAEDSAKLDGISAQSLNLTDQVYFGLSVSSLDQKEAIPFLSPSRQRLLEYDIARAISQVTAVDKPVVGVMSPLPVAGQAANPMMMQMGQQGQEPWVFYSELQRDFDVRDVATDVTSIDEDINVLLVVHPKNLSEGTEYALDQFVLRGGNLVVFVDPFCLSDNMANMMNPLQRATQNGSSLTRLMDAWGIAMEEQVVADLEFVSQVSQGRGGPTAAPAVLSVTKTGINDDDVVTSQIDSLVLAFAGALTGEPAEGLEKTVLLHSTKNSQLVEKMMAQFSGQQIMQDFEASDTEYPLAVRLTGKFKTAFANGKPEAADESEEAEENADATDATHLTESETDGVVVLVGDVDLLTDQFSVRVQNFLGNRIVMQLNGNLNLIQGLTEQMAGDEDLIAVRGRATLNRPFTRVKEMQLAAEENYRAKIKQLEEELSQAQQRLNELQREKDQDQRFILSPEQQKELERFRQREVEVKRELKEVRKQLRRDVDALETRLTWANMAGMPVLVLLLGIAVAVIKSKKTSAK